jgi:hypothetical protein
MSDEHEAAYEPEVCEECGEYVPDCACGADSAAWLRDRVHRLGCEVDQLTAENARLKEFLSSRSELAATTIAGLEMEVGKVTAERDALMALAVHFDGKAWWAFEGTYLEEGDCATEFSGNWTMFPTRDEAVHRVRKAAGLDPIFGSPVPPADGATMPEPGDSSDA